MGLWSAPCRENYMHTNTPSQGATSNITRIEHSIVTLLKSLETKAKRQTHPQQSTTTTTTWLPVNTLFNTPSSGLLSYPSFMGPCRSLTYADINVWYDICKRARVDCVHVYLHRNPYHILQSTTVHRHFNSDLLHAIHLYTTLLSVIYTQLARHSFRTFACVGFFDDDGVGGGVSTFATPMADLLGFPTPRDFETYFQSIFHPTATTNTTTTNVNPTVVVPPHYEPYMKSFVQLHKDVLQLCRQSAASFHE
jgi:hypothetical protein